MLLDEITILNQTYLDLQDEYKQRLSAVQEAEAQIPRIERMEERFQDEETKRILNAYAELYEMVHQFKPADLAESANGAYNRFYRSLENHRRLLRNIQEQLDACRNRGPVWNCTKKKLKQAIDHLDNILPRFTSVGEDTRGAFIRFAFEPLLMYVQNVNESWIKTDTPAVWLGRIVVRLYPCQNRAHISGVKSDPNPVRFRTRRTVHPHIHDDCVPCFGDFTGPIFESLQNKDFVSVVALVRAFLQQADANDVFGRHWMRPILNRISEELQTEGYRCSTYSGRPKASRPGEPVKNVILHSPEPGVWTYELEEEVRND